MAQKKLLRAIGGLVLEGGGALEARGPYQPYE